METAEKESFKFAMMSGALKNAGDFLIVRRSEELLRHVYPNAEFTYFNRCAELEPYIEEINQLDAMIFCGGPAYLPQLYPQVFPLTRNLEKIHIPMFALGLGWFGSSIANKAVYHYHFSETTLQLLRRIECDTKSLGCRDWYSVNVLRNNGIYTGKMTGCPAWYNLKFIEKSSFSATDPYHVKKVCISDPANGRNLELLLDLALYVRQVFSKAEVVVVFHRGIKKDAYTDGQTAQLLQKTIQECEKIGVQWVDISYGEQGFAVYDNCDFHIGFRVHAHIYNLSRRNVSVLVEEDARGAGVNEGLGLGRIPVYDYGVKAVPDEERIISTIGTVPNKYFMQMVDDHLNNLYQTDFLQIKNAYQLMQEYFKIMKSHIESLEDYL